MAKTFNISLPQPLVDELDRRAREEGRSRSELLREAARAYLEWGKDWQALRAYGGRQARRLGFRPAHVPRLIREVRAGRRTAR